MLLYAFVDKTHFCNARKTAGYRIGADIDLH